jgi:hypothetical protein
MIEKTTPSEYIRSDIYFTLSTIHHDVYTVHRHFISVCYVSGTIRIGIKRIAA